MAFQRCGEFCVVGRDRGTARHDHQVDTCQGRIALAECFAHQAFEPIAVNRTPDLFARYGKPQTGRAGSAGGRENRKVAICGALWMSEYPLKIGGRQQAHRSGETAILYQRASGQSVRLGNQTMAAFGATRIQHLAAATRRHPGAKTMSACTLDAARLESTFHDRESNVIE